MTLTPKVKVPGPVTLQKMPRTVEAFGIVGKHYCIKEIKSWVCWHLRTSYRWLLVQEGSYTSRVHNDSVRFYWVIE